MSSTFKRLLTSLLLVCGGVYLVLSIYLYNRQTDFIFFPSREIISTPQDYRCDYADVRIPLAEGGQLHGWWLATPPGSVSPFAGHTLLYMHGNGGNVGANSEHACRLNKLGFAVLIFDYRGYGQSDPAPGGKISEKTLYADAEAAWWYLLEDKKNPPSALVLYGHSLGGAVAVEMAQRHPDAGELIVQSTFSSMADMGNHDPVFRFFPIRLILDQKMESEEKLRGILMPMLVMHGEADSLIPYQMSQKLYAASASPRKQLFLVPRAGHENVAEMAGPEYGKKIAEFLDFHAPTPSR